MSNAPMNRPADVRKIILDNGLTILLREDRSAPVVSAQVCCRAGSITEGQWLGAGLSHVLEHMLFKGTPTRGVAQIAREIEDKGGYINAYTSFEQTVYYINIPSENWRTAVDVLADCVMNAAIPEAELLKEKQVILREMAMNADNPDRRSSRMLWSTAYTTHPYRHPVIGHADIYNRITRDDVVAYYRRMYAPNNLVFVVVGDVNAADVEARIRELTKEFKMGSLAPAPVPAEPPQLSLRQRHEEAPVQLSQIHLAWHVPAITHPDIHALDLLAIIAGQGKSSRLYRQVRQQLGLAHSIDAGSYTPSHPGLFMIGATADAGKRDAAIAAIREEMKHFAETPVSEAECQKAIKKCVSHHVQSLTTMAGQASDLAQYELLVHDPLFSTVYLDAIRRVTPADVQRVARRYLTDGNLTIVSLNPPGMAAGPETAATGPAEISIQKFELANGLRLLVREDPKLPLIDCRALLKGGVIAETDANNGITKLTARMLLKGTPTRSAEGIADAIESVGGEISSFAGNNSFGVSAHVLQDDFDLALDVLADVLQHPVFPDDLLKRERDVQLAELKDEQDHLLRHGQQLLREALFTRHPYRFNILGTPASVAGLGRADLAGFHRRYVVANNIVLTVFGAVKADDVRRKVEEKFGLLQPVKLEFPRTGPERLAASTAKTDIKPKEQAVLLIGYSGADVFGADRFALELLNEAYTGQGSRLFLRLRDELGLCYYCGAYELLGIEPGYFAFYVGTTPENVEICRTEILAELDKLRTSGLGGDELERAKNSLIGQRRVKSQDNAGLSVTVGLDELYGLGYNFHRTMDEHYKAVTTDDIKRVANNYFGDKPRAVVVVRPPVKGT